MKYVTDSVHTVFINQSYRILRLKYAQKPSCIFLLNITYCKFKTKTYIIHMLSYIVHLKKYIQDSNELCILPTEPNTSLTSTLILKSIMLFIDKRCSLFYYFLAVMILRIGLSSGENCFKVSGQPEADSETFSASSLDLAHCVWYVSH